MRGRYSWAYLLVAMVLAVLAVINDNSDYALAALISWQWSNIAELRGELDHCHRRIDIVADAQNERQEGGNHGSE